MVKNKLVSHSNVYKYVSSNIEHVNKGGQCKPVVTNSGFDCDIVPDECVTTSNILGWYLDRYWKLHVVQLHCF